jgi:hypothetical protein
LFYLAVSHIANYLNQYLKRQFNMEEDIVVISSLVDADGSIPTNIHNKIVIFIVNFEKDYSFNGNAKIKLDQQGQGLISSPLHINFNIVVSANFSGVNYSEALKLLSAASHYFQSHPLFDHQNTPDLDKKIQKLILEFENLSLHDLSNLWGVIGGKYLPSIVYKLRTVILSSDNVIGRVDIADKPTTNVGVQ